MDALRIPALACISLDVPDGLSEPSLTIDDVDETPQGDMGRADVRDICEAKTITITEDSRMVVTYTPQGVGTDISCHIEVKPRTIRICEKGFWYATDTQNIEDIAWANVGGSIDIWAEGTWP